MSQLAAPFRAFTVRADGLWNRVITDVKVCEAYDPARPPSPLPRVQSAKAIWDTGATRSVISASIAQTLGLPAVGDVEVCHAGGIATSPTYVVNFKVPNGVMIAGALVTQAPLLMCDVLIGMDVITLGDMALSNVDGKSCMSFRTPSLGCPDFVAEHRSYLKANVGRNAPCPCGSKKTDGNPVKFKDCHGR